LKQVCESLEEAHSVGLIHRDIKPANIFLCKKGLNHDHVKVLDFGLVRDIHSSQDNETRLTMAGNLAGTPAFMAPEMATNDQEVSDSADIYSLGCVAYWMLTGSLVFDKSSPLKMVLAHIESPVIPPSKRSEFEIPRVLENLILACLEKKPQDRPRDVREMIQVLNSTEFSKPWNRQRARQWWETHRPTSDRIASDRVKKQLHPVKGGSSQ
jgi:serine/threonine-protein kinase